MGKVKEFHSGITGYQITTVEEQSVKSIGRWHEDLLSHKRKEMEIFQQREDGLKVTHKAKLSRKFKVWCLQCALYPQTVPMIINDVKIRNTQR